jgi:SAM-dependent methyltransferase
MGFSPGEVATYENAVWSRCAKGYMDGFRGLTGEAVPALLDAAEVTEGDRVLDVSCGPGLATTAAIERGASAISVDFSEAMVNEARRRNPGVGFRVADAHLLPFEDGSFGVVVSNLTLHHLGDPDNSSQRRSGFFVPAAGSPSPSGPTWTPSRMKYPTRSQRRSASDRRHTSPDRAV